MKIFLTIIVFLAGINTFSQTLQTQLNTHLKTLESKTSDLNALYQVAEIYVNLGGREENISLKKALFEKAVSYSEKCRQAHPATWQTNFALALSYGALQQVSEDKTFKKTCAKKVKEWIDIALKINPKHADSWSVLGMWHYRMANLGKLESFYLGDLKNGASNDEAKKCLQKAIQLDPNDLKYYPMMAKICQAQNQNNEAESYLKKAISMAGTNPEYQFLVKRCNEFLKEL